MAIASTSLVSGPCYEKKSRKSLVKRVTLPCPTREKSCRANQIAESLSYDVNGMLITSAGVEYSRVALSGATFLSLPKLIECYGED